MNTNIGAAVLGAAPWTTAMAMLPVTTSIRIMACLLGALKTLNDFPSILQGKLRSV